MPKRSFKEREAYITPADSKANDQFINQRLVRLEQLQPPPIVKSPRAADSPSVESTRDSSLAGMKEPFPSIVISPDATPISSATGENNCRSNNDAVVEVECDEHDVPTTALDHKSPVTLILEKAPLHVAPRLHKERPDRIEWIRESLQNKGLLDKCHVMLNDEGDNSHRNNELDDGSTDCSRRSHKRHRSMNTHEERVLQSVQQAHSAGFVKRMEKLKDVSGCSLQEEAHQYDSIYLTQQSWTSAMQSTSSLCKLVDHILSPEKTSKRLSIPSPCKRRPIPCGFACIRPPGHHASRSLAHGYCLINHVAVAAKYALEYHGCQVEHIEGRAEHEPNGRDGLESQELVNLVPNPSLPQQRRVAILDWDVHHGDGTQSIFWNDPNVLFFSIHAQKAFPFGTGSSSKSVGGPQAFGKTVNVAWTSHGMGDKEYFYVLETLILPMLQEFQPTLVLISAGFDAAAGEGYSGNLSPVNGFGRLTTEILKVTNKLGCPVIASLEGGYKRSVLGPCVASVIQSMVDFLREPMSTTSNESGERMMDECGNRSLVADHHEIVTRSKQVPSTDGICPTAVKNVEATREAQRKYWKCLS